MNTLLLASLWHLQVPTLVIPVLYYSRALVQTNLDLATYLEGKMSGMAQILRDGCDKCVMVCILWVDFSLLGECFLEQLRSEFGMRFSLDHRAHYYCTTSICTIRQFLSNPQRRHASIAGYVANRAKAISYVPL